MTPACCSLNLSCSDFWISNFFLGGFNFRDAITVYDQTDYQSLCAVVPNEVQSLLISLQAGKVHCFHGFSNQANEKCYILGATVLNLSC